jgi:hypothetical protein
VGDPLEGFRDAPPPPGSEYEHERKLVNTYYLGKAVEKLRLATASVDDLNAVMKALTEDLEDELRQLSKDLLNEDNLDTPAARSLHFQARVCGGIMAKLNAYVASGIKAGNEIRETQHG